MSRLETRAPRRGRGAVRCAMGLLCAAALAAPATGVEPGADAIAPSVFVRVAQAAPSQTRPVTPLQRLIDDALKGNPEIAAALLERDAANHRISPAGALDDPMLEAGLASVPTRTWRLNSEDMTMKMLGISQRFPYPGKRALRRDVAAKEAESLAYGVQETVNRVVREVKVAYYDLALIDRSIDVLERNRQIVAQLLRIVEGRYSVGQAAQADVLKAQTQLAKMSEEIVRMRRERRSMEADMARALGRGGEAVAVVPEMPQLPAVALEIRALREAALRERPQLLGLKTLVDKNQKALELARRDYYPDFDIRVQYGQREPMPGPVPRSDLISFTVAINLPIWEKQKLDPRVAEIQAMREQAMRMYQAQENELMAKLRQQIAIADQSRESARLYETGILPQARLALESALSAYRVNRVDFAMLLDSQMTVLNYEIDHAGTVVAYNKALAEIDQLVGKTVNGARPRPIGESS